MITEEQLRDQLEIADTILDSKFMEFDAYAHVEGYILALKYVLGKSKAMFNKEDI